MPRAETGNGVSVVRSKDKVTVAAWEGNALHRVRGCLSASGVTRSMHSSGVIVTAIFGSLQRCGLYLQPDYLRLPTIHSTLPSSASSHKKIHLRGWGGAKAQSPTNMAKVLSPTIILLFAADNGPAAPAAKVAEPKMAAAPRAHPKAHQRRLTRASCSGEGACWRWH